MTKTTTTSAPATATTPATVATNNVGRITTKPGKPDTSVTTTTKDGQTMSTNDTSATATTTATSATESAPETTSAPESTETTSAPETATSAPESAPALSAADRARAAMAAEIAPEKQTNNTVPALSNVPSADGITAIEGGGKAGQYWFNKGVSHVSWYLSGPYAGVTRLDISCNRRTKEVQLWHDKTKLFTVPGRYLSDRDALTALGFVCEWE